MDNVDPDEVAKFEDLAERWWDEYGEFKPLHAINPLRLDFIDERAGLSGKRVLDVGCGGGILSESMAARGALVTGIDMAGGPLAIAKLHLQESGVTVDYQQASAEQFAATHADAFDIVTCMELLEHVPDPASTVAACAKLVRPGGEVFFSTLNRTPKAWLYAVVGAEYVLRMLPRGTHDYSRFIRPAELARAARHAGITLTTAIGLHYSPLGQRYWLGPGVDVNYMVHGQRRAH